ncbi:glutathione S-transferase [Phaeobacter marinintestinus]|uniref:glutathione S-transferase n=1 Tax=Falsiphaeobacter marinintestinus TaxID=1492905 RepID=UPI0011B70AD0|nr:glutathione S-transferase [Phaeobacter marinintestinus]
MKLITADASPFARKVRVVLRETGQTDAVEEVQVMTTPVATADEVKAANPLGKIPALILDDGRALFDSRVITRYLDSVAGAGLYPEDRIWDILTLEAMADGILEAAVLMVYEGRVRPEEKQYAGWVEAQWAKAIRGVGAVNDTWMEMLSGPLNMCQISVGCALGYLDFRHPDRDWRADHPALAEWYVTFGARPAMEETRPA